MTRLLVKVSEKNKSFVIYNHLFVKTDSFTIEELQKELSDQYGLNLSISTIKAEIEEYLNSGLVMHDIDYGRYKSCMDRF